MSLPFAVLVILLAPNVASTDSIKFSEGRICDNRLHEPTPEVRLMLVYIIGLRMQALHRVAQWWSESVYKAQLCLAAYSPKWCIPLPYQDHESAQDLAESAVYKYAENITQSQLCFTSYSNRYFEFVHPVAVAHDANLQPIDVTK